LNLFTPFFGINKFGSTQEWYYHPHVRTTFFVFTRHQSSYDVDISTQIRLFFTICLKFTKRMLGLQGVFFDRIIKEKQRED
jgi:hypothetical protein